jgi:hypothetical protein
MAKGQRVSAMVVEEAFASGDSRFLELFGQLADDPYSFPKRLEPGVKYRMQQLKTAARIVEKWKRDHRPWAREQLLRYLEKGGLVPFKGRLVVKRFFKHADVNGDDQLMGAFMWFFDRQVRRVRVKRWLWEPDMRGATPIETLRAMGGGLFSAHTSYYCRRRAWRYFRRMGFKTPEKYPAAVAAALARYRDEDLQDGDAILDSWGLMHACFGGSDAVDFNASHAKLARAAQLNEMLTPYFEELWKTPASAGVLLGLASGARSRVVRTWAGQLIRRDHRENLRQITAEELLALLDHPEEDAQELGAELLEGASAAGKFDVATWLKLLGTRSLTAVGVIVEAMKRHVRAERLTLAQKVDLARAKPVPVARLGLEFLREAKVQTEGDRRELVRLAGVQAEGVGGEIAGFALSILGASGVYDGDTVVRFFDSLNAGVRGGAWDWLVLGSAGWEDSALWARLVESPYEDVRMRFVAALEDRQRAPWKVGADALRVLWTSVLLGIHRGGRAKLTALRQISEALLARPDDAEVLLPVAGVAIRSVRFAEARAGLAAVVSVMAVRPEVEPLVKKHLPELSVEVLEGQGVAP